MQKTRCAWRRCRLKEQMGCIGLEGQIAELVNDQQFRFAKVSKAVFEPALAMRLSELGHQGSAPAQTALFSRSGSPGARSPLPDAFPTPVEAETCCPIPGAGRDDLLPLFIRTAGGESQLCGVIRSAASRCW